MNRAPPTAGPRRRRWPALGAMLGLLLLVVGVQASEAVASAGLALTVMAVLADAWPRRREIAWRGALAKWRWLILFCGWALVAPAFAGHAPTGTGVGRLFDFIALPALVLAFDLADERWRRRLVWTGAGVLVASCLFTALQHFGLVPSVVWMRHLAFFGTNTDRVYQAEPGNPGRFLGGGLLFHRLKFAHVSGFAILFCAAVAVRERGRHRWIALALGSFALVSIIAFALVRAASVAAFVGAALVVLLTQANRRRAWLASSGAGVLALSLIVAAAPIRKRFSSSLSEAGSGDRPLILESGLRALESSPVVGLGLGRFRLGDWVPPNAPREIPRAGKAHNQFLTFAIETGVPGALLFIALLVSVALRLAPTTWRGAFGLAALLYFALLSMLHDPLFHAPVSMAFVLALGWALSGRRRGAQAAPVSG